MSALAIMRQERQSIIGLLEMLAETEIARSIFVPVRGGTRFLRERWT
jgi:hypothetical protein